MLVLVFLLAGVVFSCVGLGAWKLHDLSQQLELNKSLIKTLEYFVEQDVNDLDERVMKLECKE